MILETSYLQGRAFLSTIETRGIKGNYMLCFVKNPKSWLVLAKYDIKSKKWIVKPSRIPYEEEDTRFRRAVLWLDCGWNLYPEKSKATLQSASSIYVSDEFLEVCWNEYNQNPFSHQDLLDTREFFRNLRSEEKPLPKAEQKKIIIKQKFDIFRDRLQEKYPNLFPH